MLSTWSSIILIAAQLISSSVIKARQAGTQCTVTPLGNGADDVPQILDAFAKCNNGGTVVFPEGQSYNIASKLNPVVNDITVEWRGTWVYSADLDYWRDTANTYPISFQNHHGKPSTQPILDRHLLTKSR